MKQLIILAYYFKVENKSENEVKKMMEDISPIISNIKSQIHNKIGDNYQVELYAIPTPDVTKLECVYPRTSEDEQHEQEAINQLQSIKEHLKKYDL